MFDGLLHSAEWVCQGWNTRWAHKEAFPGIDDKGYFRGNISGHKYRAHRVIWAMVTGSWPADQIDHINHVRSDNRWQNLREANNQINQRNRTIQKNNSTGTPGVHWHKANKKWIVFIHVDKQRLHLGCYNTQSDAIAARKNAEIKHNFHPNHGMEGAALCP